jgi:hypothetical protein
MPIKKDLLSYWFFLVLTSKAYFLYGYFHGTWRPNAPFALVLTRDLVLVSFMAALVYFFAKTDPAGRLRRFYQDHKSLSQTFLLFSVAALAVLATQLFGEKTLTQISQHYGRNILVPVAVFVAACLAISSGAQIYLKPALKYFAVLNVALSILQIYFFKDLMWINRPTGILGDPLLNSAFILLGLLCFDWQKSFDRKAFWIFLFPAAYVLSQASSLSAILAIIGSCLLVYGWSTKRNKQIIGVGAALGTILILAFSFMPQTAHREGADAGVVAKVSAMLSGNHYSVQGRIQSNLYPINLCAENPGKCILGDPDEKYHLLDSLWASMLVNWGAIFTIAYLWIFLVVPIQRFRKLKGAENDFAKVIFYFYWIFSLFNMAAYKYPLNILFYLAVAQIFVGTSRSLPIRK